MGKTVLLVEDNDYNLDIYGTMLRHVGFEVLEATDGEAAVRLARERKPDLILMDVSLPGMDGWTATRLLKKDDETSSIPIIALTAHALPADQETSRVAGCDGYLAKPIEPRRVVEEVERVLGKADSEARQVGSAGA